MTTVDKTATWSYVDSKLKIVVVIEGGTVSCELKKEADLPTTAEFNKLDGTYTKVAAVEGTTEEVTITNKGAEISGVNVVLEDGGKATAKEVQEDKKCIWYMKSGNMIISIDSKEPIELKKK